MRKQPDREFAVLELDHIDTDPNLLPALVGAGLGVERAEIVPDRHQ
jgi:hypothetical protein